MRNTLYALLAALVIVVGVDTLYNRTLAPCAQPLSYSIGAIDPRFGITEAQVAKLATTSEALWEKAAGKDLLDYKPGAAFKINLIYDDRQARTDELKQISGSLQSTQKQFDTLDEQSKALTEQYDAKRAAYEAANAQLQKDLDAYNKQVDDWNAQGGAPQADFEALQKRKQALNARSTALEASRQDLNALAKQINALANQGQSIAADYNSTVSTYNQKFGTSTVFDQGVYNGKEIDIYQFKGMNDLELVLTHEMGHALGLDHVADPKAVMYYLMQDQDLNHIALSSADVAELKMVCKLK